MEQRMFKRRSFEQTKSLKQRLADEGERLREQAKMLPSGLVRDAVLMKVRQTEAASHMNEWLTSPGLQSPT
jgi:hypothetical protein